MREIIVRPSIIDPVLLLQKACNELNINVNECENGQLFDSIKYKDVASFQMRRRK